MTRLFTATSCVVLFFMLALMPFLLSAQAPALVFPKSNIVTSTTSVPLEWNKVAGAVNYHIQVAESSSFSPVTQENQTVSGTVFNVTLASGKKYYWRVRANTGSGYTGWSSAWSFTVFSPSDVNVTTWYKADYGVQLDVNGKVSQWNDASPSGNHATQSVTNFRPSLVTSAPEINDMPLLRFDGTDDFVLFNTYLTSIETVFWVVKERTGATNKYRSLLGDYNNGPHFHRGCCDGGFPGPTKYIYDNQYAASAVMNGTTRINGSVVPHLSTNVPTTISILSTKTTGNTNAGAFTIDRPNIVNEYRVWDGDLAELILFNDPLNDSLINLVTEYLRYKYAPPVNLGADRIEDYRLCNTITLSLNYYKTYAWSTGATTSSIQVSSPGIYSVSVTDQFNRTSADTVQIEFIRPDVIEPSSICLGDSVVWNTGLSNDYSFEWQDESTGASYTIRGTGDYWVYVTDSTGCGYQSPIIHVEVDSFAAIADLGSDTLICLGQSIGLVSGEHLAEDYWWSTGDADARINIYATGLYYLTVTDDFGCEKIDSISVDVGANAPSANFSAPNVCFGQQTDFTDLTTITQPNFVYSWFWNFGDGQTDTLQNPVHTYNSPGTYTVTLTAAADNQCTNSKTKTVKVYALPHPLFRDSLICVNTSYQFQDESSVAFGATFGSWLWDFDDNSSSAQQHPNHAFASTGTFNVTLTVTDSRGCANSYSRPVESIPPVAPAASPNLIRPTDDITISNSTVIFDWQASSGSFYYSLQIATDASFTNVIENIDGIFPDSAVVGPLAVGADYYWRVLAYNMCGEYTPSAIHQFNLFEPTAIQSLCLWLSADKGVTLDINQSVKDWQDNSSSANHAAQTNSLRRPEYISHVDVLDGAPVLKFDGLDDYVQFNLINTIRTAFWVIRENPNATPYYRSLLGNTSAQPDFHRGCCDDGFPGTKKYIYDNDYATSSVITGTTRVNSQVIDPLQTKMPTEYSIITTKTTGNAKGNCMSCDRPAQITTDPRYWYGELAEFILFCDPLSDSLINVVEAYLLDKYAPPVNLGPDVVLEYGFCTPTTLNAGDRFVSLLWSTGDTTSSFQAYGPGNYWVLATDIFGFVSYDEVHITGGLNTFTFADTLDVCMGDSVLWDTQLGHNYDFEWQDGSNDSFFVIQEPGEYWVKVTDSFNCSVVSNTVLVRIDSFAVQASLGVDTNLCSGNMISLNTGQDVATSYVWSTGSRESAIIITQTDDYFLFVQNINGCSAYDSIHVNIIGVAPNAGFSFSGKCLADSTFFTDQSNPSSAIASWNWDFDDGILDTVQNPAHVYQSYGIFLVNLTVTDTAGCSQSTTNPVTVHPLPSPSFTHDLVNCAVDDVYFHDESTVSPGQIITGRLWDFGDGNTGTDRNPVHNFQTRGYYPVSLTSITNRGCSATITRTLEIFPELVADIRVEDLCFDQVAKFYDNSPSFSNISWQWNFGDNIGMSNKKNPTYSYLNPGTYAVTLHVKNAIGCERTVLETIGITARPTVDFANPPLCDNVSFHFSDNTVANGGDDIVGWQWDFGDQSPASADEDPVHVYAEPGQYSVSLNVLTENGCVNSGTKTIEVIPHPTADFTFTPQYGAAPLTVHFTNRSANALSYAWDFGDNAASAEVNPVHTYNENETEQITLVATSVSGCSDTVVKSLSVVLATLDIGIDKIFIEKSYNDDCSYYITMGALVQNIGTREVTSFDIQASNSGGGTIAEHWTGDFEDRQLSYQFNASFLVSDCEKDVVICMEVMNPNGETDENELNNSSCLTLSPEMVVIGPYPNPAGENVNLDLVLPVKSALKITNYSMVGEKLDVLADQKDKGYHRVTFDTRNATSGVYMFKIEYREEVKIVKYMVR